MTPPQKERIIDQAMQMFATQGIKSVRMDDIAQHLGVSKRTLYELFGDKEGLLYLAMERYFQRDRQRWTELTANARNVLEAMFMVLAQVMDKAEVSSRMMDNLKKFYPAVHDKLTREGMEKNRRSLRGMLDQGIVDGLFVDNINIDLAISVLYYTASALVTRKELMLPAGMTEREAFVQIISNFFRGISTAKGLRLIDCTTEDCDLSFEYSHVNASVKGDIVSVKNPKSGKIVADSIGKIILKDSVINSRAKIVVRQNKKKKDVASDSRQSAKKA